MSSKYSFSICNVAKFLIRAVALSMIILILVLNDLLHLNGMNYRSSQLMSRSVHALVLLSLLCTIQILYIACSKVFGLTLISLIVPNALELILLTSILLFHRSWKNEKFLASYKAVMKNLCCTETFWANFDYCTLIA